MNRVTHVIERVVRYPKTSSLGAGVLIGLPFVFSVLWPVSFVGIALVTVLALFSKSPKDALIQGSLSGFALYLFALGSIALGVFPFDWYGIEHQAFQVLAVGLIWAVSALVCGVSIGIFSFLVRVIKTDSWHDRLLFPSLWVVCETVSAYLFYILHYGVGSFSGPHFTLGYVGYLLAEDPVLLQFAFYGGVYALSFCAAFIGTLLARALCTGKKVYVHALLIGSVFLLCAYAMTAAVTSQDNKNDARTLSVAVISRYMPPTPEQSVEFENERYRELRDLIAPLRGLDMVVLPENAVFLRSLLAYENKDDFTMLMKTGRTEHGPVFIDSEDSLDNGIFRSQVAFLDAQQRYFGYKQFLLPFGEYIPYAVQGLLRMLGSNEEVHDAVAARNYAPGEEVPLAPVDDALVGVRFCDESMSPLLYHTQVRNGAKVLVNISSYSWFNGSSFVFKQMQHVAKVRAVESGRWFVQSGNMAPAFVLDHHGHVVAQTSTLQQEVLVVDVPQRSNTTPYTALGAWVLYFGGVIIGLRLLQVIFRPY
jgi:apolipoprotein N-acyltransferase